MEHRFTSLPPIPLCAAATKSRAAAAGALPEYQRMDIELRPPHAMPTSHWHGQVEVNAVRWRRGVFD